MSKFTQGKWIANGYVVESEDGKTIADCGFSDKGVDEEEKSNAHLIAAAPDMYAMLDVMAKSILTTGAGCIEDMLAIESLLKKARGE
ncbi:MAG TPA: hypothetical protein EYO58_01860 [Flavobacteriales bacterium]|nr:hypothetical protein [Flavobacteriales bacterium]